MFTTIQATDQRLNSYLTLEYNVFSLPVLEHAQRLQCADDIVGMNGCLLAKI
jgi:hypothetical protein